MTLLRLEFLSRPRPSGLQLLASENTSVQSFPEHLLNSEKLVHKYRCKYMRYSLNLLPILFFGGYRLRAWTLTCRLY